MRRLGSALLIAAVALGAVGCTPGSDSNPPGGATPTPSAIETIASASPSPDDAIPSPTDPFRTSALTVTRQVTVPPVPVIINIRSAQHPEGGYDRIVFDISGALPGYDVRYVTNPVRDPSGQPATVPGRKFLQIRFEPAQAHTDSGATVEFAKTLNFPMLTAYEVTGDFEGVVNVVLGLDDDHGFRVGELSGRIYVDVAAT